MKLKKIDNVYDGYFKILEATVETSKGEIIKREIFSRASKGNGDDGVAAIVYDIKKHKYIFTKQFRVGLYKSEDKYVTEAVAGTLKEGEDPKECMIREIEEELGYSTENILPLGEFYVSPGGSAEKIFLYEAYVSDKVSEGGGLAEEHEEIETIEMTYAEMRDFVFNDAKTIVGVQKMIMKKNRNIYTILEEIGFEEKAKQLKKGIENGVDPEQLLFSALQDFYSNILSDKDNDV